MVRCKCFQIRKKWNESLFQMTSSFRMNWPCLILLYCKRCLQCPPISKLHLHVNTPSNNLHLCDYVKVHTRRYTFSKQFKTKRGWVNRYRGFFSLTEIPNVWWKKKLKHSLLDHIRSWFSPKVCILLDVWFYAWSLIYQF